MKEITAELVIENGGGNQQAIFDIIHSMFKINTMVVLDAVLAGLLDIDCDHFYMANNAKVTRPIKKLLEGILGKEKVAAHFPEFCKRVGNLYAEVRATAALRPTYFSDADAGEWGDEGSCFMKGGCNRIHGKLINVSPCTGVITIEPVDDRYAKGRIIVWFKNSHTAHLINKYSRSRGRELPHSVFVRALEELTGTKLSYHRSDNYTTLPIYLNNTPVICTTQYGTDFDHVVKSYKFKCAECGVLYDSGARSHFLCSDCVDSDDEDYNNCENCGHRIHNDDSFNYGDYTYCESCYSDIAFYCECCNEDCDRDDQVGIVDSRGDVDYYVCSDCASNNYYSCSECGNWVSGDHRVCTDDGRDFCNLCARKLVRICDKCNCCTDDIDDFDEDGNCSDCHEEEEEEAS